MIWMRRMYIVNWMYYGIQTIEWERSNLLTGITGSGKSSLIDALKVVILGENSRFLLGIFQSGYDAWLVRGQSQRARRNQALTRGRVEISRAGVG